MLPGNWLKDDLAGILIQLNLDSCALFDSKLSAQGRGNYDLTFRRRCCFHFDCSCLRVLVKCAVGFNVSQGANVLRFSLSVVSKAVSGGQGMGVHRICGRKNMRKERLTILNGQGDDLPSFDD